jgi:nucleotide-binding universal stress UspA family protein
MSHQPTVIAGHDGTTRGLDAITHASRIAQERDARLVVVHVIAHQMPYSSTERDHQTDLRHHLEEVFGPVHAMLADTAETRMVDALSTPIGLRDAAEDEDAEMVVVGPSHHGAVGRVLYGDVANWLSRHCDCPVEVAPVGAHGTPEHAT